MAYFLLGYNVIGVELYRKRDNEPKFTLWKTMALIATNRATYRWMPTTDDAGKYEFAAFVRTKIPVPSLEVAPNSIQKVEVSCFATGGLSANSASLHLKRPASANRKQTAPQAAASCADTWVGTSTVLARTPGVPGSELTSTANVTWTYDRTENGSIIYTPSGSVTVALSDPRCTIVLSPNTFAIVNDAVTQPRLILQNSSYTILGQQFVTLTTTASCPGSRDVVTPNIRFFVEYASGGGAFTGQARLSGTYDDGQYRSTWDFSRP